MPEPSASLLLETVDWGRTAYAASLEAQDQRVAARIAGEAPDALIFTEHDPVFTVGLRTGADQHLVWNDSTLAAQGVTVSKTNRGGDITYHGPGQIVGYPIVDLSARKDLHAYLRFLEEVMIRSVGDFGLVATRREGKTGIWIEHRKVAAIGVAVRRWVTYHGFALNVSPNLDHFGGIVPCGIAASEGTVTSLAKELSSPPSLEAVKRSLDHHFRALWPAFVAGSVL